MFALFVSAVAALSTSSTVDLPNDPSFGNFSTSLQAQLGNGADLSSVSSQFGKCFAGQAQAVLGDVEQWIADFARAKPCAADLVAFVDPSSLNGVGVALHDLQNLPATLQNLTQRVDSHIIDAFQGLQTQLSDLKAQLPDINAQLQNAQSAIQNLQGIFQQFCGSAYGNSGSNAMLPNFATLFPNGQVPTPPTGAPAGQLPPWQTLLSNLLGGSSGSSGSSGTPSPSAAPGGLPNLMNLLNRLTGGGSGSGALPANLNITLPPNVQQLINMYLPTPAPTQKRQSAPSTAGGSLLTTLLNAAQQIIQNGHFGAQVGLLAHCQALNASASTTTTTTMMKRQQGSTPPVATQAAGLLSQVLSHCQNIAFPSQVPASVQAQITMACQAAATTCSQAASGAGVQDLLNHVSQLGQTIQTQAQQWQNSVTSLNNTLQQCAAAVQAQPNNGALQMQFQTQIAQCHAVGVQVATALGASYQPGGASIMGGALPANLQAQVQMCASQLSALRSQFDMQAAAIAPQCPGLQNVVKCVRRASQTLQVTLPSIFNCSESFVDALQNGVAALNSSFQAFCASSAGAPLCAQFQQHFATAEWHLTNATDVPSTSADPSTDPLCRRDASFELHIADPSLTAPMMKRQASLTAALNGFCASVGSMASSCQVANNPPPSGTPTTQTSSSAVPPIAGVDNVMFVVTAAPSHQNAAAGNVFVAGVVAFAAALLALL